MTIRVHISNRDFLMGTIAVTLVNRVDEDLTLIYRPNVSNGPLNDTWERAPQDGTTVKPSFHLPDEGGRALLDALAHHYEGAEDTRRLRADYDAALKRSDAKDHVIADVVRSLAANGPST